MKIDLKINLKPFKINKPLIGKKTKNLTQSVVSFEKFSIFGKITHVSVNIEHVYLKLTTKY
jgi:hypothetical protein